MESIRKELKIGISSECAYDKFLNEFNQWWPSEYTWSQDQLKDIWMEAKPDGLCTEIGPYGFRCDWGRVTELIVNRKICLKWQISPQRVPVPNPTEASDIQITFIDYAKSSTLIELEHCNFENHGEGAEEYQKMMNAERGWELILHRYKIYCEKSTS